MRAVILIVASRYRLAEGVVVGRRAQASGELILALIGPGGAFRAVARGGEQPKGRSSRLGLFNHVKFQVYQKNEQMLPLITQVELIGSLAGLQQPRRFGAAGFLGELAFKLASPEAGAKVWPLLVSGLRGISQVAEPLVPLVWAGFRILAAGGLAPRLESRCGHPAQVLLASGEASCTQCARGLCWLLPEEAGVALAGVLALPGKEAVAGLSPELALSLWPVLLGYAQAQLGRLNSAEVLRALEDSKSALSE